MKTQPLRDLNISPEELKKIVELLARERGIKDYESMSGDKLLNTLKSSENKNKTGIGKIREKIKELPHKFSRLEIKEMRKNFMR